MRAMRGYKKTEEQRSGHVWYAPCSLAGARSTCCIPNTCAASLFASFLNHHYSSVWHNYYLCLDKVLWRPANTGGHTSGDLWRSYLPLLHHDYKIHINRVRKCLTLHLWWSWCLHYLHFTLWQTFHLIHHSVSLKTKGSFINCIEFVGAPFVFIFRQGQVIKGAAHV